MLRFVLPALLCSTALVVSGAATAEDFSVVSRVEAVTLYPYGGAVARSARFSVPAGAHRLLLSDLPLGVDPSALRVSATGVRLGAVTLRQEARPPRPDTDSPEVAAARDEVERRRTELLQAEDAVAAIRLRAEAAAMQIAYLGSIRAPTETTPEADAASALVRQIGGDALAALQAAHEARIEAREAERDLKTLREVLDRAQRALAALVAEDPDRLFLAITVTAEAAAEGELTLRYRIQDAGWQPVYDFELNRDDARVTLRQGAMIGQTTGENWQDVELILSTTPLGEAVQASVLFPRIRRVFDPVPPAPTAGIRYRAEGLAADQSLAAPEPRRSWSKRRR